MTEKKYNYFWLMKSSIKLVKDGKKLVKAVLVLVKIGQR